MPAGWQYMWEFFKDGADSPYLIEDISLVMLQVAIDTSHYGKLLREIYRLLNFWCILWLLECEWTIFICEKTTFFVLPISPTPYWIFFHNKKYFISWGERKWLKMTKNQILLFLLNMFQVAEWNRTTNKKVIAKIWYLPARPH